MSSLIEKTGDIPCALIYLAAADNGNSRSSTLTVLFLSNTVTVISQECIQKNEIPNMFHLHRAGVF